MFKKMIKDVGAYFYIRDVSRRDDTEIIVGGTRFDKETNSFVHPCDRLSLKEIEAMLKIVDEELIRSYHFGLKISREHVLREKTAILFLLNEMGNLYAIPKRFEFEEVISLFSRGLRVLLSEELFFYFEKLKKISEANKKKNIVRSMYNLHLLSVYVAIFRSIYGETLLT